MTQTQPTDTLDALFTSLALGIEIEGDNMTPRQTHNALQTSEKSALKNANYSGVSHLSEPNWDAWTCGTDPTASFEVQTNPTKDVLAIVEGMAILKAAGANGQNTGTHVNVDARHLNAEDTKRLLKLWLKHEPAMFNLIAKSRRRSTWNRPMSALTATAADVAHKFAEIDALTDIRECVRYQSGRYNALNLNPMLSNSARAEFRLHQGTFEGFTITNFSKILCMFLNAATRGVNVTEGRNSNIKDMFTDLIAGVAEGEVTTNTVTITPILAEDCRIATRLNTKRGLIWSILDRIQAERNTRGITNYPTLRIAGRIARQAYVEAVDINPEITARYVSVQLSHWRRTRTVGPRIRNSRRATVAPVATSGGTTRPTCLQQWAQDRVAELAIKGENNGRLAPRNA